MEEEREEEREEEEGKKGSNWWGWILTFLLFVVGPHIIPIFTKMVYQFTGGYVNLQVFGTLPLLIGLAIIGSVVVSMIKAMFGALRTSTQMPSPTGVSIPPLTTPRSTSDTMLSPTPSASETFDRIEELFARYSSGTTISGTARSTTPETSNVPRPWDDDETSEETRAGSGRGTSTGTPWDRSQQLPGPPQFEPIISGKVVAFGILGLLLIGGAFFLSGMIQNTLQLVVGP